MGSRQVELARTTDRRRVGVVLMVVMFCGLRCRVIMVVGVEGLAVRVLVGWWLCCQRPAPPQLPTSRPPRPGLLDTFVLTSSFFSAIVMYSTYNSGTGCYQ